MKYPYSSLYFESHLEEIQECPLFDIYDIDEWYEADLERHENENEYGNVSDEDEDESEPESEPESEMEDPQYTADFEDFMTRTRLDMETARRNNY